jgi:murein DD-endopeptidase MepM/ murein hydrolase activator NlpD
MEGRTLLAASIVLTATHLVDSSDHPITAPVTGEEVFLEADWTTNGLAPSDSYVVGFTVDGVTLSSTAIAGQSGNGLTYYWYLGGWYASAGSHSVSITVDPGHALSGVDESRASSSFSFSPSEPTTLPSKLIEPIGGTPFQTWSVVNYLDVNPLPDAITDYNGGTFTYDGHNGYDTTLGGDFAAMDAGVPIFAAAAGTITQVSDGHFDRQTGFNSAPANYIVEDFGNGWTAEYYHLTVTSKTVQVGQTVAAGQLIGLVGSSGNSTDAHLHFDLQHNGDLVETYDEPNAYWLNPLPYQGSVPVTLMAQGITNSSPFDDSQEGPVSIAQFPASSGWDVWYWYRLSYLKPTDTSSVNWYDPQGDLVTTFNASTSTEQHYDFNGWFINSATYSSDPGNWRVAVVVDGKEVGSQNFVVTPSAGLPRVKLTAGPNLIHDGRTTPITFATVAQGGTPPTETYTINNVGSTTLTVSSLSVPAGFQRVGPLANSVAPGSSATFTLQFNSGVVGVKFGQVILTTNDPATPTLKFNISGEVTGSPTPNAATITNTPSALATDFQSAPRALDPGLTFVDPGSPAFATARATISLSGAWTANDQFALVNQGTGAGQVGVSGSTITYGGVVIGTLAAGSSPPSLMTTFNASATLAAVQAVLRDVTYVNTSASPTTAPRYAIYVFVDGNGIPSNEAVRTIVNSGVNRPPSTPSAGGPYAITEGGPLSLAATGSTDVDADPLTYSWDLNGDGVFGDATGLTPTLTWAQLQALGINRGGVLTNVRVEASDGVNVTLSNATTLTIASVPPAVAINAPASSPAGLAVATTGSFTDVGNGPWSATVSYGDGTGTKVLALNPDKSFALTHVYASPGSFTIVVSVTDTDGQTGTGQATASVTTSQQPTQPSSGGPYAVTEGGTLALVATPSTGGAGPLTYSWDVNGDGVFGDATGLTPTLTWAQLRALGLGRASSTVSNVRVQVSDGRYAPVVSTATTLGVTVSPPLVALGAGVTLRQGASLAGSGQFTSSYGPWTATVSYGDGTATQPLTLKADKSFALAHAFARVGSYTITVAVTDANQVVGSASLGVTVKAKAAADFDSDGKTDLAVFDQTSAVLYELGTTGASAVRPFGNPAHPNVPLAGDYDGDGKTDTAIFDPTIATFYVQPSGGGATTVLPFGNPSHVNVPIAGDFDGDGKTDYALFDETAAVFYVLRSGGGGTLVQPFGNPAHVNIPVGGDFDGDGKTDLALYDQTAGIFYVLRSGGGGTSVVPFGNPSHANIPIPGDFDGDGKVDYAIYDQTSAVFYVLNTGGSGTSVVPFGNPAHLNQPLAMDRDGDGKVDFALYDPAAATFYDLSAAGPLSVGFGNPAHANLALPGTLLPRKVGSVPNSVIRPLAASPLPSTPTSATLTPPVAPSATAPVARTLRAAAPAGPLARISRPSLVAQADARVRYA